MDHRRSRFNIIRSQTRSDDLLCRDGLMKGMRRGLHAVKIAPRSPRISRSIYRSTVCVDDSNARKQSPTLAFQDKCIISLSLHVGWGGAGVKGTHAAVGLSGCPSGRTPDERALLTHQLALARGRAAAPTLSACHHCHRQSALRTDTH